MRRYPDLRALLDHANSALDRWEASFGPFERHPSLAVDEGKLAEALDRFLARLTAPPGGAGGNYPFFHPRYAGQMLKPPHPVAVAAYTAALRVNPNNHALDGGPPTGAMEKEVVAEIARMFGLPEGSLGHLTGGGTVANLEALWVARELHPEKAVAFSSEAHYTHARMAQVLGLKTHVVAATPEGRVDLDALEAALKTGSIGTVVLTAATTGLGAVDPIADALPLLRRHGARLHVDAAYGGFFTLLAGIKPRPSSDEEWQRRAGAKPLRRRGVVEHQQQAVKINHPPAPSSSEEGEGKALEGFPAAHFRAIAEADSVVVDPHKHGLQPYGCGCVLFRDPSVGRFYKHDSPYTYFTSNALHLGEISLECSRPGAAAAALWLTLQVLPLRADDGLGPVLAAGLRAARRLSDKLEASALFRLYTPPETDIVVYFPAADSLSGVDAASRHVFARGMADADPLFLSLYRLEATRLTALFPALAADRPEARALRSVLMKPEHEGYVDALHARVEALARA